MQSKGAIKFVAILIALACIYQLSFTWATRHQESKGAEYAAKLVEAEKKSPAFANVPELDKAYFLDSLSKEKEKSGSEYFLINLIRKDLKEQEWVKVKVILKVG